MALPKCSRFTCRPMHTEHSYRSCDRHSIWCAASGCYHNAVGATLEEANQAWARLVQPKSEPQPPLLLEGPSKEDDLIYLNQPFVPGA